MSRQRAQQQTAEVRHLPALTDVIAALQWLAGKEPAPVSRTIIMKAFGLSRQTKVPRLLNTHVYITNLKNRILEHYRESLDQQRDDGAIAMVLRVQHLGTGRAKKLGTIISSEYLTKQLTDEDQHYSGRIREGVCRETAQILINWVQDITGSILSAATLKTAEDKEKEQQSTQQQPSKKQHKRAARKRNSRRKRDNLMTVEDAYTAWQQKRALWERAAKTPIPFGKYKGTPLGAIGKREARWLIERLLPVDEIKQTLEFVEQLIVDPNAITKDVAYEEHLYLRDGGHEFKHRRAVRAHRLVQRILDPPGELVLLEMLHKYEFQQAQNKLNIIINAGDHFDFLLPSLHEGL